MKYMERYSCVIAILALVSAVAVNSAGASNGGADSRAQKGQQSRQMQMVKRLNAVQQGSAIMLRWQPVPGCDGYRVYHEAGNSLSPDSLWFYVDVSQTTTPFSDVSAGGYYTFRISATYGRVEGPPSKPVTVIMKEARTGPSDTAK